MAGCRPSASRRPGRTGRGRKIGSVPAGVRGSRRAVAADVAAACVARFRGRVDGGPDAALADSG